MKKDMYHKTALCTMAGLVVGMTLSMPAYANPQHGTVMSGTASIHDSANVLTVNQASDKAIIDWQNFDIDVGEHTQFNQPSRHAITLNRVKSHTPSNILGSMKANGNIVLINPNGVFFGKGSKVDVGGLIATTSDIKNDDFMANRLNFSIPGNPDAAIINEGMITAQEAGLVGLVAPNVINHGIISAKLGTVQLSSGDITTADLYGDGLMSVSVSDELLSQLVSNTGKIEAEGGSIIISAAAGRSIVNSLINIEGELHAPAIDQVGGSIQINAAGNNAVAGNDPTLKNLKSGDSAIIIHNAKLDASGYNGTNKGGSIEITGDHIALLDNTLIDASGHNAATLPWLESATLTANKDVRSEGAFWNHQNRAGGSIKIGGDYLGKGTTAAAKDVYVASDVTITNDAIAQGDAGRTIIWSDNNTKFDGTVLARGGAASGNGGFLETSGKNLLSVDGSADLRAANGNKGTYLLDPTNITIFGPTDPAFGTVDNVSIFSTTFIEAQSVAADVVLLADDSLVLDLEGESLDIANGSSLTLRTTNLDIDTASVGTIQTVGNGSITLDAGRDITISDKVDFIANGTGSVIWKAGKSVASLGDSDITTNGGDVIFWGDTNNDNIGDARSRRTNITTNGGDVIYAGGLDDGANGGIAGDGKPDNFAYGTLDGSVDRGVVLDDTNIQTGSGNAIFRGVGAINGSSNQGVLIFDSTTVNSTDGNITIVGIGGSGAGVSGNQGVRFLGAASTISTTNGDISITGTGGGNGGTDNTGVSFTNDTSITGGSTNSDIIIHGTGGSGTSDQHGVDFNGTNITLTNNGGLIRVTGQGGSGDGGRHNGIRMDNNTQITSNSGGAIELTGTGGTSNDLAQNDRENRGIEIEGNAQIIADGGAITLTGTGGVGNGFQNQGISAQDVTITNSASGNITLNGTGGTENTIYRCCHRGVEIRQNTNIQTANGDILVKGTSAGNTNDPGILFFTSGGTANITSTGSGSITLDADGGAASDGISFSNFAGATNINAITNTGDITIQSKNGAGDDGISIAATSVFNIGNAATTGNITILQDALSLAGDINYETAGTIRFAPITAGRSIGLNGAAADITYLDAEYLDNVITTTVNPSRVTFGDANSTSATINNGWNVAAYNFDIEATGSSVIASGITSGANAVRLTDHTGDYDIGQSITSNGILHVTADAGSITNSAGTVTATTLNLDATGTMVADINATNVDIGTRSTGVTLTGLTNGGADQDAANMITGGPGNDVNYLFEGFIIRKVARAASAPSTSSSISSDDPSTVVAPPEMPDVTPETPSTASEPLTTLTTTASTPDIAQAISQVATINISDDVAAPDINKKKKQTGSSAKVIILPTDEQRLDVGQVVVHPTLVDLLGLEDNELF